MKNKKMVSSDTKYILLEQYRIAVQMADRLEARKDATSKVFISANAIFFAFLASQTTLSEVHLIFLSVFGILLSTIWASLMKNHNVVHSAKYDVIEEMEARLPWNVFKSEWDKLEHGKNKKKYTSLGLIEIKIPYVFVSLYLLLFIFGVFSFV